MHDDIDHCRYQNGEKQDGKDCLLGLNATVYPTVNSQSTNIQLGSEASIHTLRSLFWTPVSTRLPDCLVCLQGWTRLSSDTKAVSCPSFQLRQINALVLPSECWDPKSNHIQEQFPSINLPERMVLEMACLKVLCSWVGHFRTSMMQPVWKESWS